MPGQLYLRVSSSELPIAAGARSPRRGLATLLAAALVSLGPSLLAQTIAPANPPTLDDGRPVPMAPAVIDRNERGVTVRATRITTPMVIDGRLDEPVYDQIRAITEFEQQAPKEGAPVSERTEAWIFYDDTNLYVACRCLDADPSRIVANDMRRDSLNLRQNDNFGVLLDTFHDRRNGYLFYVSPVGGMFDAATSDERVNNADWNTVWLAKATRSDQGWFAEIAIPFKSLRYRAGREQTWGIILRRTIRGKNEYAYITPIKPQWGVGAFFRSSAAATLIGLEAPPAAKNLEIKPYAISRLTTDMLARPAVRNDFDRDAGLDIKYGITKSLTADFTYNTDFAQVEADEVQVNLTRFNLQFPEKRDFFLEGQGTFTFGTVAGAGQTLTGVTAASGASDAPTIFYSRRIGLGASGAVPIVAGARVTGRVGRFTMGALNIASDDDPLSRGTNTNFTVLRLRRDVLRRGTIGGLFTNRSVSVAAPGGNQVFGADSSFGFYQNVYVSGYFAKTRTTGREGDDASYRGNFNYAADRYGFQADRTVVGDNFLPEIGFLPRRAFRRNFTAVRFSPRPKQNKRVRQVLLRDQPELHHRQLESAGVAAAGRGDTHGAAEQRCVPSRILSRLRVAAAGVPAGAGHSLPRPRSRFSGGARCLVARATASALRHDRTRDRPVLRRDQAHRFDERALRHLASARG